MTTNRQPTGRSVEDRVVSAGRSVAIFLVELLVGAIAESPIGFPLFLTFLVLECLSRPLRVGVRQCLADAASPVLAEQRQQLTRAHELHQRQLHILNSIEQAHAELVRLRRSM